MPMELPPESAKSGFFSLARAMVSTTFLPMSSEPDFSPMPPEIRTTPLTLPDSPASASTRGTSGEGTATTYISTFSGSWAGEAKHLTPSISATPSFMM